jgi:MFS family permease
MKLTQESAAGEARPTRVRYRVLGLAVLLAMVTYLDRVGIAVQAPDIQEDLSLSKLEMSFVFSAFALAYAAFEIPTAWWADRAGTRTVLTRIVVWRSGFTVATAAAFNFASLLLIRFLFGMGEAGAWPSVARTFSRWIPRRERGTVQGIFFSGPTWPAA